MNKRTALILMEDPERAQRVTRWLEGGSWDCQGVSSARELACLCESEKPGIIVVEGPLGEAPGVETVQWLRRGGVVCPVVFCCEARIEEDSLRQIENIRPYAALCKRDESALKSIEGMLPAPSVKVSVPGEGDLGEFGLDDIMLDVLHRKWTGKVTLSHEGTSKSIFFLDGAPTYCSSTIFTENFGQLLLRKGRISEIEYNWARKIQLREGIRQGEALVKIGVLSHQDLFRHLREQIKEKIINAFGWKKGSFSFEDDLETNHTMSFNLNTVGLMVAGRKRFLGREEVRKLWGSLSPLWGIAWPQGPVGESASHHLQPDVFEDLSEPCRLSELAIDHGWSKAHALSLFLVLEKAGFLYTNHQPESLPTPYSLEEEPEEWTRLDMDVDSLDMGDTSNSWDEARGDLQDIAESLWKGYLRITGADHFHALGVSSSASPEEIMAAREELLEIYSDHQFEGLLDQDRHARALREIRTKVSAAASTLLNETARASYMSQLELEEPRDNPVNRYLKAEDEFVAGQEALRVGNEDAQGYFARARNLNPNEPVYEMYYGWAMWCGARENQDRTEGKRHIVRAVASNPLLDDGYFFLAQIHLHEGDLEEAVAQARTALTFNPGHEGAAELLQKIEARFDESGESSGFYA